jgi:diguanylate cyclase (GGDEF)-like protein
MTSQEAKRLGRGLIWHREVTDALVIYSVAVLIGIATSYSELSVNFARVQGEIGLHRFSIVVLFLGIASAIFGLRRIADQFNERRRRVAAEEQALSLSLYDPLTLLPNRRCLEKEIETAIDQAGGKLAVLLAGLNELHIVNSVYGHASGDAVVSQISARLRQVFEKFGFVARVGTDAFALLIGGDQVQRVPDIARNLVDAIEQPVRIGAKEYIAETHVGIVQLSAPLEPGEVLRRGFVALDRARNVRADCCYFDPEMDVNIRERALLEQDFRFAVASNAMHLCYQPIVDLRTGRIASFEALARWTHPRRGVVSPETFILLGEDLDLIHQLSAHLFAEACEVATAWPQQISLSFNFSARQLRDASFAETIFSVLNETGLPASRLEVEITESTLVSDFAAARQVLTSLQSAGIRIVMDDFGTGYSSLRHLHELRFDKIKIDRSFVNELRTNNECAAIVAAVSSLGRSLEIATVVEGIETRDQLALAKAAGCTHGQGYLFGRPRLAAELSFGASAECLESIPIVAGSRVPGDGSSPAAVAVALST